MVWVHHLFGVKLQITCNKLSAGRTIDFPALAAELNVHYSRVDTMRDA